MTSMETNPAARAPRRLSRPGLTAPIAPVGPVVAVVPAEAGPHSSLLA
jgi:hypothetical protein